MTSDEANEFEALSQSLDLGPETIARNLRETLLTMTDKRFNTLLAYNSVAIDVLANDQLVRFYEPEIRGMDTARGWWVPTLQSDQYIKHDIPEMFVYQPYNVPDHRRQDGSYGISYYRVTAMDGSTSMVAVTELQTLFFSEDQELVLEDTDEGVKIVGVKIDEDTTDTDLPPIDPELEMQILALLQDCYENYRPTSQTHLPKTHKGDNESVA